MKSRRFRADNVNWPTFLFIAGYHLALLVGLPFYFVYASPGLPLIAISIALLFFSELGITTAYHRFYSHRAYDMHPVAEFVLLALGTLAIQGSALRWSADHRKHHAKVDTDEDPYAITKGFWYAHCLWLFEKPKPIDEKTVADLAKNPMVRFQDRHIGLLAFGGNIAVALAVGFAVNDFLGAVVLAWFTRMALGHHLTWFINSLAHTWGERTYSKEHSAVDNFVIAVLTVGEGYHNYHHTFASDYRNGVRWYHFDPGKWTIWSLDKLGLAGNLKRYTDYNIKRRLLQEDRKLLIKTIRSRAQQRCQELEERVQKGRLELAERVQQRRLEMEERVQQLSEKMQAKLKRLSELAEDLRNHRRAEAGRDRIRSIRREYRALKQSLRDDWRSWNQISGRVLAAPG